MCRPNGYNFFEWTTFRNPSTRDIVIDLDTIPALEETTLGYSTALEIEYVGDASAQHARNIVRGISRSLGYDEKDILTKALPGRARPLRSWLSSSL